VKDCPDNIQLSAALYGDIDVVNHVPTMNKFPYRVVSGRSASASLLGWAAQLSASQ